MVDFSKLRTTLAYTRLGLVSLTAAVAPITATAQELCGTDLFEGEPDAAELMNQTVEFLDILKTNGVVAFEGFEGRMTVDSARQAIQDGVGSASLLACVVNSESIEFIEDEEVRVIACGSAGAPSLFKSSNIETPATTGGQLFCTQEVAAISKYLGSEA